MATELWLAFCFYGQSNAEKKINLSTQHTEFDEKKVLNRTTKKMEINKEIVVHCDCELNGFWLSFLRSSGFRFLRLVLCVPHSLFESSKSCRE